MYYYVKHYTFDAVETEKILLKSMCENVCWDFIRNHLTCSDPKIRKNANQYVVMDSLNRLYDPSMDIVYLKKFNGILNRAA